jgi:hypothetical protein
MGKGLQAALLHVVDIPEDCVMSAHIGVWHTIHLFCVWVQRKECLLHEIACVVSKCFGLQRTCIFQAETICLGLQGTCVVTGSYLILH